MYTSGPPCGFGREWVWESRMVLPAVGNGGGIGVSAKRDRRRKRLQPAAYISLPERSSCKLLSRVLPVPHPLVSRTRPSPNRQSASSNCQRCCTPFLDCRPRFLSSHFPFFLLLLVLRALLQIHSSKKFFTSRSRSPTVSSSSGHPRLACRPLSRFATHTHGQDHVFQKRHPHVHWQQWRRGSETRRRRIYC